jgi:hypothetical protein
VLPRPLELVARVALAATVLLWLSNHYASGILKPLIPVFQDSVSIIDDNFTVLGMDLSTDRGNRTLSIKADLAHPIHIAGQWLAPMNSNPRTAGWMQVDLTLGGILQYSILLLVIVLAWPAASILEFAVRAGVAVPLVAVLLLIDVPLSILAELWFPIHDDYDAKAFWPLLAWSRFMMGGGGQALALLMGIAAIGLARHFSSARPVKSKSRRTA